MTLRRRDKELAPVRPPGSKRALTPPRHGHDAARMAGKRIAKSIVYVGATSMTSGASGTGCSNTVLGSTLAETESV